MCPSATVDGSFYMQCNTRHLFYGRRFHESMIPQLRTPSSDLRFSNEHTRTGTIAFPFGVKASWVNENESMVGLMD